MTTWKSLTKPEKKHLREMGITTLREFKKNAETQAQARRRLADEGFSTMEPCWDCRFIARKMELPV